MSAIASVRLGRDEYVAGLHLSYAIARAILTVPAQGMVDAIVHAETVAPFIDPTLFRNAAANLELDKRVVEILARAKRELEALPQFNDPAMPSERAASHIVLGSARPPVVGGTSARFEVTEAGRRALRDDDDPAIDRPSSDRGRQSPSSRVVLP